MKGWTLFAISMAMALLYHQNSDERGEPKPMMTSTLSDQEDVEHTQKFAIDIAVILHICFRSLQAPIITT